MANNATNNPTRATLKDLRRMMWYEFGRMHDEVCPECGYTLDFVITSTKTHSLSKLWCPMENCYEGRVISGDDWELETEAVIE